MADRDGGFLKGFILGSIVGAVMGVFLTPKTGREMREEVGEEAEKLYTQTKSDFEHARKAAMKSFEEGRDKILNKLKTDTEEVDNKEEKPKTKPRRSKPRNV